MSKSNRRTFLGQLCSAAIVIPELRAIPFRVGAEPASAAPQASASSASYDLLIAGGRCIDLLSCAEHVYIGIVTTDEDGFAAAVPRVFIGHKETAFVIDRQ